VPQNCRFENFVHEFTSLVNFHSNGGNADIVNCEFERFSTTGAIIKNYYGSGSETSTLQIMEFFYFNYVPLTMQLMTSFLSWTDFGTFQQKKTKNFPGFPQTEEAFHLLIENCLFQDLTIFRDETEDFILTTEELNGIGRRYQSPILNLCEFKGPVIIHNSVFQNILMNQINCKVSEDLPSTVAAYASSFPIEVLKMNFKFYIILLIVSGRDQICNSIKRRFDNKTTR
jgi:hypothetical protein